MTTARRQASSTSLSRYANSGPEYDDPSLRQNETAFCNSFWGIADGGVEVLFARMRGAARTMDELRAFWKERASIEEEYSRRLGKLAKQVLGRDEIGDLRASFEAIRTETENQSKYHGTLANEIRTSLEGQTSAFYAKQQHHRKTYQSGIEKEFKAKQLQEGHVAKAREKYETDCMRINSYTAQLGLVQGRDAERIHLKLEQTKKTVLQNERDFANFARALAETVAKWEADWRVFCDSCQDLEDDRINFMKDNMWVYANAVSTVCVSDDEACEHMRLALEQMEPERDQESFVRTYGTGNHIPDPPPFVDYKDPNSIPSSSAKITYRIANFARSSQRPPPGAAARPSALTQPETTDDDDLTQPNGAGVGTVRRGDDPSAVNGHGRQQQVMSRQNTVSTTVSQTRMQQPQPQQAIGSFSPMPSASPMALPEVDLRSRPTSTALDLSRRPTSTSTNSRPASYRVPPPMEEPEAMLRVGDNAYKVDLRTDPQAGPSTSLTSASSSSMATGAIDPFAKQMEDLQTASATVRRKSTRRAPLDTSASAGPSRPASVAVSPGAVTQYRPPSRQQQQQQQQIQRSPSPHRYRDSAEMIVGQHPSASRSTSPAPQPITAAFMRPRSSSGAGPPGADIVADVLGSYQQSLPGESKMVSRRGSYVGDRPGSVYGHNTVPSQSSGFNIANQQHGAALNRPPSGMAGIGTPSRSTSPAPPPMSRGPSPAPGQLVLANQRAPSPVPPPGQHMRGPSPGPGPAAQPHMRGHSPSPQRQSSQGFIAAPPPPSQITRSPSPNKIGIALDSSGRHPNALQQQQQQHGHAQSRSGSTYSQQGGYGPPQPQQQQQPQQGQQWGQRRSPSPAPGSSQQQTSDGKWILFYVKALFPYTATIEEEFDFQEGDIIAVTATPDDGWWSGELLDETRRVRGKHVFPSNFVELFP
ncbi:hypothetical protein HMN09_01308700 [Mycena chlorophos]|uniref:Cell division control protein n=1 Tax=Mycena chlorophos TaxID=658473 RepID=A0A8H6S1A5_MYCCL|nr:hypothetical protein HMN09_01308700 [Mycena chlorophos]